MRNAEPVQLRQVRDFGQLISTTFTFLRQNWKPLFRAIAVVCLPIAAVGGLITGGSIMGLQRMSFPPGDDPVDPFTILGGSMLLAVPGYILLLAGFLMMVAMVHEYLRAYHLGEHAGITTGELARRGWSQLGPYLGLSFLSGVLAVIGMVLCVLPFFYVWTMLSLVAVCHAIERTGGTGALTRSSQLVKGDFWPTLGLVIVIALINALVNYAVQIPIALVSMAMMVNSGFEAAREGTPGFPPWFGAFLSVATAVQWCVAMLTYPIVAVCMGLKYFSRVEETEGRGLKEKIAGFDQA